MRVLLNHGSTTIHFARITPPMHPALALATIAIANCAIAWIHYLARGTHALGVTTIRAYLKFPRAAQVISSIIITTIEELAFRVGVPTLLAQNGASRGASREISSLLFGAIHISNALTWQPPVLTLAQQSLFAILIGRILFDVDSFILRVIYHESLNTLQTVIISALLHIHQARHPHKYDPYGERI